MGREAKPSAQSSASSKNEKQHRHYQQDHESARPQKEAATTAVPTDDNAARRQQQSCYQYSKSLHNYFLPSVGKMAVQDRVGPPYRQQTVEVFDSER